MSHCRVVLVHLPAIKHHFARAAPAGQIQWELWIDGTQERSSEDAGSLMCSQKDN